MALRTVVALAISIIMAAPAFGQGSQDAKAKARVGTPVFKPAADLKWTDLDPSGAPGRSLRNRSIEA